MAAGVGYCRNSGFSRFTTSTLWLAVAIVMSIGVAGCSSEAQSSRSGSPASSVVEMSGDYPYIGGSRLSLALVVVDYLDSTSIVEMPSGVGTDPTANPQAGVSSLDPKAIQALGVPSTISRVRVVQSLAGDIKVGSIISVDQDGGDIDGVKYRETSTSLLSEAGYEQYVLLLVPVSDGYRLVDPVLGVFGKSGATISLLKPDLVENESDRSIDTVDKLLAVRR